LPVKVLAALLSCALDWPMSALNPMSAIAIDARPACRSEKNPAFLIPRGT
jgi:hypothetical protein